MPISGPPNGAEYVVTTRGLVRSFGSLRAVDDLDLDVRSGECLGLLGPNGAGKSTTVRILSTLLRADAGRIEVLGLDPLADGDALRKRIGVVPQEIALYGDLSGRQNLSFFGRLHDLASGELEAAVKSGLELAGLEERADDRVKTYSGGMKRRLNIAVALLHRPELVFLDEPTVGIDPQSRNRVFEMVESLAAGGTTMIYTSHQLGEVERLCDRIVILDRGRKVAEGSLAELQRHEAIRREGEATLRFSDAAAAGAAERVLAEAGIVCAVVEEFPDLEEVFLGLTGRALRDEGGA
jgi:ABC-2 type transport system ATP-binding protein